MTRILRNWLRILAVNILLGALLIVGVLAAVEGYLHATIPASSGGPLFESTLATRRYKIMRPAINIVAWGSDFRTNRLGFRDNRLDIPPKAPGGYRIVVLGDSFTVCAGVDFEKIFTSRLQRQLQRSMPRVEVINLAVAGYNIIQYELVLDEVAFELQPDLVVVAAFPYNDLSNETYRANFDDAAGKATHSTAAWHRDLYVYRAFLWRIEARVRRLVQSARGRPPTSISVVNALQSDAEQNLAALRRIIDKSVAHGVAVVVALLPNTDAFEPQRLEFAPFVALCQQDRWQCLNMLDGFIASGATPDSLRLNLLDSHPNDRYNVLAAGLLNDYLSQQIRTLHGP